MRDVLGFPDPVDEVSARLVAAGVVLSAALVLALRVPALTGLLAAGFLLRVAAGPRLSPLAIVVTRVLRPRLPVAARPVPGPPKRFAQGIGAAVTAAAFVAALLGAATVSYVLTGVLLLAAAFEAGLGLCVGCRMFAVLMRVGVIPAEVCPACADVRLRPGS